MDDRSQRFAGRVALVAGGATDVSRAVALRLAREGAAVAVVDADPEGASATCRAVEAAGGRARMVRADVARGADAGRAVAEAVDAFGGLDVAFIPAPLPARGMGEGPAEREWERCVEGLLRGVYLAATEAVREMGRRGGGAVVLCTWIVPRRRSAPGTRAAQGAVASLARGLAAARGAEGIRVNGVCVGALAGPAGEQLAGGPRALERAARRSALGRLGTPEEVAAAVAFLASDEAAFITGAVLPVDGGLLPAGGR